MKTINNLLHSNWQQIILSFVLLLGLQCATYNAQATIYITTNTTHSSNFDYTDEVVIQNGAVLTITGLSTIVTFSDNVIVKPECKLILNNGATVKMNELITLESNPSYNALGARMEVKDGAKITAVGTYWLGVEVWGIPSTNLNQKAMITLNKATIEKARCAVATYRTNIDLHNYPYTYLSDKTKRGGTIKAQKSFFTNNNYSIDLIEDVNYPNSPNSPSFITLCDFETNYYYFMEDWVKIPDMIEVTDVEHISILGCTFKNNIVGLAQWAIGIHIINSGVKVAPAKDMKWAGGYYMQYMKPCAFDNVRIGIYFEGNSTLK